MNWTRGADEFLTALSSSDPTPGGGAAAALAGAMGCALGLMSIGTTLKRKSTPQENHPALLQSQKKLAGLHSELKTLMQKDAEAYTSYLTATKLPKDSPTRAQAVQDALWFAAMVPADTATTCEHVLTEIKAVRPLIASIILSDLHCAQHLLASAITCCVENIRINQAGIISVERQEKLSKWLEHFSTVTL